MNNRDESSTTAMHDDSSPVLALALRGDRFEAEPLVHAAPLRSTNCYGPVDLSLESMVCLGTVWARRRRPQEGLCL